MKKKLHTYRNGITGRFPYLEKKTKFKIIGILLGVLVGSIISVPLLFAYSHKVKEQRFNTNVKSFVTFASTMHGISPGYFNRLYLSSKTDNYKISFIVGSSKSLLGKTAIDYPLKSKFILNNGDTLTTVIDNKIKSTVDIK